MARGLAERAALVSFGGVISTEFKVSLVRLGHPPLFLPSGFGHEHIVQGVVQL